MQAKNKKSQVCDTDVCTVCRPVNRRAGREVNGNAERSAAALQQLLMSMIRFLISSTSSKAACDKYFYDVLCRVKLLCICGSW